MPVFRGLFAGEIEFGGRIAGIVDTSGTMCARCDFWESREFEAGIANWGMKFGREAE